MDIATALGLVGAISSVLIAMGMGGAMLIFIDFPSALIVVGGSAMVVMMKFSMRQFLGAIKIALKAFLVKPIPVQNLIKKSVEIADAVHKGGVLSLESFKVNNELLQKGIQLLADGHSSEMVKTILTRDMVLTVERHLIGQKIFRSLADIAPAMGMIGTLIGLVQMLSAMDDPKSIGPALALALLTTLYGAVIANLIAIPIADKLELRSAEERRVRSMVMDAVLAIQSTHNPVAVSELLKSYLPANVKLAS